MHNTAAAAGTESAQPASDNSTQQNQQPAERTDTPHIPDYNGGTSRLQPEQVPHQQAVAGSQAPPTVCIVSGRAHNTVIDLF